jgi:two-component system response regulator HydG
VNRVLVVDDDRQMVKTLCDVLRRRGWEPEEAYSGEEAVAAAERGRYGAVLMDVRMSGMNGVEAFRAIREAQPSVPVILMTAYSTRGLLEEAERLGVLRILAKPFPLPVLFGLLDEAVREGESVLVVDDDPEFLTTLSRLVEARGHRAFRAGTLAEALETLELRSPEVIVLDLKLDRVEPREAILAIRRVSPGVVLILCSGYSGMLAETLSSCPAPWFHAALEKPFDPERLLGLLDELAGSR